LVLLPDDVDYDTAACLGCRFATSFRAIVDQGRVKGGEWVAVHGCGDVGLLAIMITAALGANPIAIDIAADKLEFAQKLGAVSAIDARGTVNVPESVRDVSRGGAHVSINALGSPHTCFNSIKGLRRRGRHVQVGLMVEDSAPRIPMADVMSQELEIYGSHGMQAWRYSAMLEMITTGRLASGDIVRRRLHLSEAGQALANLDASRDLGVSLISNFE
jgi:alcohol dehydrogenase